MEQQGCSADSGRLNLYSACALPRTPPPPPLESDDLGGIHGANKDAVIYGGTLPSQHRLFFCASAPKRGHFLTCTSSGAWWGARCRSLAEA